MWLWCAIFLQSHPQQSSSVRKPSHASFYPHTSLFSSSSYTSSKSSPVRKPSHMLFSVPTLLKHYLLLVFHLFCHTHFTSFFSYNIKPWLFSLWRTTVTDKCVSGLIFLLHTYPLLCLLSVEGPNSNISQCLRSLCHGGSILPASQLCFEEVVWGCNN